jgi:hypothetical protein
MSMPIDGSSQESTTEEPTQVEPQATEDHSTPADQASNNPFWGPIEEAVGPNTWKVIQPHLAKADTEARQRIERVNAEYAPWKAFADQGITPDVAENAFGFVRNFNDPNEQVAIYQSLHAFLEKEGRLPETAAEVQQVVDDADEGAQPDPRDSELQALRDQQQQVIEFLNQQAQAQAQQEADTQAEQWLDTEIQRTQQAHPDLDQADMKQVVRLVAFSVNQGQPITFDQAVESWTAERDRIRTTQRPNDFAPRVPGATGGTPGASADQNQPMSKADRIAAVAARFGQQ